MVNICHLYKYNSADFEAKSTSPGAKKKKQSQLSFAAKPGGSSESPIKKSADHTTPSTSSGNGASGKPAGGSSSFSSYCNLCLKLYNEPSYNAKTAIVKKFLEKGIF